MRFARDLGVNVSNRSIDAIVDNPQICDIVFDATTASSHITHAPILKALKKYTIDLTPSLIGKMCIPCINSDECLNVPNINMVTCGGQATVPLAYAIAQLYPQVDYFEIVSSISSKSAGPGTRDNIDEFTQTTKKALLEFTHCKDAKALIIINPAEPPIIMNNTVYAILSKPDIRAVSQAIHEMVVKIQQYVPGYKIILDPIYNNSVLSVMSQVTGKGDYLPPYSGNLDIITSAAVAMAEKYATHAME